MVYFGVLALFLFDFLLKRTVIRHVVLLMDFKLWYALDTPFLENC